MTASSEDVHHLCTTCTPFATWPARHKAYNIFCGRLMEEFDSDGSTVHKEYDEKHTNHELEDILVFATHKWRALLLNTASVWRFWTRPSQMTTRPTPSICPGG